MVSNIQKSIGKSSDWTIHSVIDHNSNLWKFNPLAGSNCSKLEKEIHRARKDFMNIYILLIMNTSNIA